MKCIDHLEVVPVARRSIGRTDAAPSMALIDRSEAALSITLTDRSEAAPSRRLIDHSEAAPSRRLIDRTEAAPSMTLIDRPEAALSMTLRNPPGVAASLRKDVALGLVAPKKGQRSRSSVEIGFWHCVPVSRLPLNRRVIRIGLSLVGHNLEVAFPF